MVKGVSIVAPDYSSLDLHLTAEAYKLNNGSVKPFGRQYLWALTNSTLATRIEPDARGDFQLAPRHTYLFRVKESLYANVLRTSPIYGQATAKSSVGRVDVLARLIVDGMSSYEEFTPLGLDGSNGDMFIEITPMTFPVIVREGIPISQLRFFLATPSSVEVRGPEPCRTMLRDEDTGKEEATLSVDLRNTARVSGYAIAAFRAKKSFPDQPIKLWTEPGAAPPEPSMYWETRASDEHGRLTVESDVFYIFRSAERIALPKGIAVYCRAIDETIGEIRIHYAGFVHPFFGLDRTDATIGTPLIFEVRGHGINVNLRHRETLARLTFYRMSEDAIKDPAGQAASSLYNNQTLQLSKFFGDWA